MRKKNNVRQHTGCSSNHPTVAIVGSGALTGSRVVPSEEVDRAFGMPIGKLRNRAGIESVAYAAEGETELTLGAKAAEEALRAATCGAQELDWIVASSETHHNYPSLAAQLHSRLLARETCGALDVGGACLGLLNAFAVAQSLISSGAAGAVAVVTADVHSRSLTPGRVAGEFGGLFGDGASAFVVRRGDPANSTPVYRIGEFLFGCVGNMPRPFRWRIKKTAASTSSSMAKRSLARPSPAWRRSSPRWNCAAGYRAHPSAVSPRINRIRAC